MEYIQPALGFIVLVSLALVFSSDIKAVKIKYITIAMLLQIGLALLFIKLPQSTWLFEKLSFVVLSLKEANDFGVQFVFGYLSDGAPNAPFAVTDPSKTFIFAFAGLSLVIFMSALSALLWHMGIMPAIVNALSLLFKKPLDVGGPVGLSATANVFLGQLEAPLLVRPYLGKMTRNELLITMTIGMSTIAGSVMVIFTSMLMPIYGPGLIGHFISASILSVPAGIMFANIMIPPEGKTEELEGEGKNKLYSSSADAISQGTQSGIEVFINVAGLLIVVLAFVYLINLVLGVFPAVNGQPLSLELILGYLFAPIAWCMGIPWEESITAGTLLGVKTAMNEFVAYIYLADVGTYPLSEKSRLIMLYGLCGFANFSSVAILLSGLGAIIPHRKDDLIAVSGKALWAAFLASCMTGYVISLI